LPVDFFLAFFGQGNSDRPAALEPGRNAGFFFERAIKLLRVPRQLGHGLDGAQMRNQARRGPGRTAGHLLTL